MDIIGILGNNAAAAVGTQTSYTVPTGKAAKFKLMYYGQGGAGGTSTLELRVNGVTIFKSAAITASNYIHSSTEQMSKIAATVPNGLALADVVSPAPEEFYASAGDTVQAIIAGEDFISLNVAAVGAEVDVV